jgi:hypothetical protein
VTGYSSPHRELAGLLRDHVFGWKIRTWFLCRATFDRNAKRPATWQINNTDNPCDIS